MTIADDLLPACTVRIDVRDTPSGSGFFVGRGVIATCAHVVESPGDPSKAIADDDICAVMSAPEGQDRRVPVRVRRFKAEPVDLAVLLVRGPFDNPSVLLDSGPMLAQDKLHTFAYPERKPKGVPRGLKADGRTGEGLHAFSVGQIQSGMSGGPLFNFRTGGVCGVISITRDESLELGGYAVPVKRLFDLDPKLRLENGRVHEDSTWVRAAGARRARGQGRQAARAAPGRRRRRGRAAAACVGGRGRGGACEPAAASLTAASRAAPHRAPPSASSSSSPAQLERPDLAAVGPWQVLALMSWGGVRPDAAAATARGLSGPATREDLPPR
jgi:Trypsin-like peptidase domain